MARIRPETGFDTTLAGGATAVVNTLSLTTAPTETTGYMVIEPGTSNKEIIKYSGVSSTTLTGVTRGLALTGSADTAGTGLAHSSGVTVSMTNVHYYMEQLTNKTEANTWTAHQTFETAQILIGDGSTDEDELVYANNGEANKPFLMYDASEDAWVFSDNGTDTTKMVTGGGGLNAGEDIEINASDIDYVGDSNALDAGETIEGATLPVAVYQKAADNEVYACDGNDATTLKFLGLATSDSTDGNSITVQDRGTVAGFTGLTEGSDYYVQDDKTLGTTVGTFETKVGVAISETQLLIQRGNEEYIGTDTLTNNGDTSTAPTGASKAVFVGNSGGTYGSGASFTVYRKGATNVDNNDATGAVTKNLQLVWSGDTITLTSTDTDSGGTNPFTGSGTLYYYT